MPKEDGDWTGQAWGTIGNFSLFISMAFSLNYMVLLGKGGGLIERAGVHERQLCMKGIIVLFFRGRDVGSLNHLRFGLFLVGRNPQYGQTSVGEAISVENLLCGFKRTRLRWSGFPFFLCFGG